MQNKPVNRRRVLQIIAAASVLPAKVAYASSALASPALYKWRGSILGARAGIDFYGADRQAATDMTARCLAEVDRLEDIFSLFRATSQISRLNQSGILEDASFDMRLLLSLSGRINQASNGAFDPSIQPLWRLYANWFSAHPGSKGPPEKSLAAARELVNFNQIKIDDATIRLAAGQAISLNGIAQGYITDRISHMLKQAGWHHVLVNLGEYRAIDGKPDGSPFRLGLAGAQLETDLSDMALASTSPDGFVFPGSQNGSRNTTGHVIDPRTGITPQGWQTVHVRHRSAATADGLSTAFAILDTNAIQSVIKSFTGTTAWAVAPNGDVSRFQS